MQKFDHFVTHLKLNKYLTLKKVLKMFTTIFRPNIIRVPKYYHFDTRIISIYRRSSQYQGAYIITPVYCYDLNTIKIKLVCSSPGSNAEYVVLWTVSRTTLHPISYPLKPLSYSWTVWNPGAVHLRRTRLIRSPPKVWPHSRLHSELWPPATPLCTPRTVLYA